MLAEAIVEYVPGQRAKEAISAKHPSAFYDRCRKGFPERHERAPNRDFFPLVRIVQAAPSASSFLILWASIGNPSLTRQRRIGRQSAQRPPSLARFDVALYDNEGVWLQILQCIADRSRRPFEWRKPNCQTSSSTG